MGNFVTRGIKVVNWELTFVPKAGILFNAISKNFVGFLP